MIVSNGQLWLMQYTIMIMIKLKSFGILICLVINLQYCSIILTLIHYLNIAFRVSFLSLCCHNMFLLLNVPLIMKMLSPCDRSGTKLLDTMVIVGALHSWCGYNLLYCTEVWFCKFSLWYACARASECSCVLGITHMVKCSTRWKHL